ncbi:MAG: phosphotransferase family protein [Planctomycetota bacterium]
METPAESDLPWDAEIEVSEEEVRAILESRFPEVEPVHARRLGAGWDFTVFEVNGRWVFRLPRHPGEEAETERECALLEALGPRLHLPVPEPAFRGRAGPDFPWPFAGFRKLEGVSARDLEVPGPALTAIAAELGGFADRLHAFPAEDALGLGFPARESAQSLEECRGEGLEHLRALEGSVEDPLLDRARDLLSDDSRVPEPWPREPVLVHGDLHAEHVLLDPETFAIQGIIDWSDAWLDEPAREFACIAHWMGEAGLSSALGSYGRGLDPEFMVRTRYRAVCVGVATVHYGARGWREEYVAEGLRALAMNL